MYPLILTIIVLFKLKFNVNINHTNLLQNINNLKNKCKIEKQITLFNAFRKPVDYNSNLFVDFLSIVKDGKFYYLNVFPKIYKDICNNLNARFFIYENNSNDTTKKILKDLANNYLNIFVKTENNGICETRFEKIVKARNNLSNFYKEYISKNNIGNNIGNNIIFLYDTDIIFSYKNSIKPLIKNLNYKNLIMLTTFSIFAGKNDYLNSILNRKNKEKFNSYINNMLNYYYDTLALNYGETYNKNTLNFFNNIKLKSVNSCFGGLALIRKDYYLTSYFDLDKNLSKLKDEDKYMICEHWSYCKRIKMFGNIFICRDSESLWYQNKDYIENKFNDYVYFFINNKNFEYILK